MIGTARWIKCKYLCIDVLSVAKDLDRRFLLHPLKRLEEYQSLRWKGHRWTIEAYLKGRASNTDYLLCIAMPTDCWED